MTRDEKKCLMLPATKLVLTSSGFPLEPSKIPSLPGPDSPNAGAGSRQESEPGSRDFMLKRGPGFLPPASPGQGRPPRDDVIDRITPDDLDKLYSDDDDDKSRSLDKVGPNFQPPTGFGGFFGPGMGFGGLFGPSGGFGGLFSEGPGPSSPFQGPAPFPNPNYGGHDDDVDEVRACLNFLTLLLIMLHQMQKKFKMAAHTPEERCLVSIDKMCFCQ